MALNLVKLSCNELDDVIAQANAEKARKRQDHIASTRAEIEALLAKRGLTLKEVFSSRVGAPGKRAGSGQPKFRNPAEPSQTWSGWGKRPGWFVQALATGAKEQELLITSGRKAPAAAKKARATSKTGSARGRVARGAPKAAKSPGAKVGGKLRKSKEK